LWLTGSVPTFSRFPLSAQGDAFVTTQIRVLVGGTALFAGLWFLSAAAAAPTLPKETYKKVAEADIVQLQKSIDVILADDKETKRFGPTVKSLAMMLAMYGEATGDAGLKDQALKVAAAAAKKDYKEAGEQAKKLAVKPGAAPLKSSDLQKMHKFALDEVMSPFRGAKVGGLNIDRDLKDMIKKDMPLKIVAADVELMAARIAILGDYMQYFPNDKAEVKQEFKDMWKKWSKDTQDLGKQIAEEASKGAKASEKDLLGMLKKLEARCSDCHNKFRDD
jgi:hypothetical protein